MKIFLGIAAMVVLVVTGCATTEQVAVQDQPAVCGFLGADVCRQLTPGQEGEAEATAREMMLECVLSIYGGDSPHIIGQKLLSFVNQKGRTEAKAA